MNKDKLCEQIFLELYNSFIQNNIEQIKESLKELISLLIHLEDKLSLENRAIIYDLFERSPQNYKIDNKFITKYKRESTFYKLIKENDISISDEIMHYLNEIENMLNKEYISIIENDLNKVSISLNVNSYDSFLRKNYPHTLQTEMVKDSPDTK